MEHSELRKSFQSQEILYSRELLALRKELNAQETSYMRKISALESQIAGEDRVAEAYRQGEADGRRKAIRDLADNFKLNSIRSKKRRLRQERKV